VAAAFPWIITYGIRAIAQPKMGEHAKALKGRQRGCWVLRGGDCDYLTLPGCGKDDVFIWNMLSLNGMRPFGGKLNTKTMRT
jgi:hypothetical protein